MCNIAGVIALPIKISGGLKSCRFRGTAMPTQLTKTPALRRAIHTGVYVWLYRGRLVHCSRCVENWQFSESSTIALNAIRSYDYEDMISFISVCKVTILFPFPQIFSLFIGNVSKCAFYCNPNCVSASLRKRYAIHITANYWHYTSGTLVNQNEHLLTLPTITVLVAATYMERRLGSLPHPRSLLLLRRLGSLRSL